MMYTKKEIILYKNKYKLLAWLLCTLLVITVAIADDTDTVILAFGEKSVNARENIIKDLRNKANEAQFNFEVLKGEYIIVSKECVFGRVSEADVTKKRNELESAGNEYKQSVDVLFEHERAHLSKLQIDSSADVTILALIPQAQSSLTATSQLLISPEHIQRALKQGDDIKFLAEAYDKIVAQKQQEFVDKQKGVSEAKDALSEAQTEVSRLKSLTSLNDEQKKNLEAEQKKVGDNEKIIKEFEDGALVKELTALHADNVKLHERAVEDFDTETATPEERIVHSKAIQNAAKARLRQIEYSEQITQNSLFLSFQSLNGLKNELAGERKKLEAEKKEEKEIDVDAKLKEKAANGLKQIYLSEFDRYVAMREAEGVSSAEAFREFDAELNKQGFVLSELNEDSVEDFEDALDNLYFEAAEDIRAARGEQSLRIEQERFAQLDGFTQSILFMSKLIKSYSEFSGLAQFGSLFMGDEKIAELRERVDKLFCDSIIGDPQCYFESKICSRYIDAAPGGSAFVAQGPSGEAFGVLHVEGEKSLPFETVENGRKLTRFRYKVTFSISNPFDDESLFYNVVFRSVGKSVRGFKQDKEVVSRGSDGRLGGDALIPPLSETDYGIVCLVWSPAITSIDGRRETEFCVPISQYEGGATTPFVEQVPVSESADVQIRDGSFAPNRLVVSVGETVVWEHAGTIPLQVKSISGPEVFDSGLLTTGERFAHLFTLPGTYVYSSTDASVRGEVSVQSETASLPSSAPGKDFADF